MPTPKNVKNAFGHHNTTYEMNFFVHEQLFYPLHAYHMLIATMHEQKELRNVKNTYNLCLMKISATFRNCASRHVHLMEDKCPLEGLVDSVPSLKQACLHDKMIMSHTVVIDLGTAE
jgi:hypothetical protein